MVSICQIKRKEINWGQERMLPWMVAIMKHGRRESTRNLQEIRGGREDVTPRLIQRPLQILRRNHLNLISILTRTCPLRQMLVLLVMIDVKRKRDLLKETNIGVEREEIDAGIKNVRGVIRDPSADQEGLIVNYYNESKCG